MRLSRALPAALALVSFPGAALAQVPAPVLHYTGHEHYTTPSGAFVRYQFDVLNKANIPAALFAAAPGLPPCGANANSSRTWVDFYDQNNRRLYGFCALNSPSGLGSIWFALPETQDPPTRVYIELNDRQANVKYRSNAERIP